MNLYKINHMLTKVLRSSKIAQTRAFTSASSSDIPSVFSDLKNHGFLPSEKPLQSLPTQFQALNEILDKMTIKQNDGSQGLLAQDLLRKTVDNDFPDLLAEVKKIDPMDARMNTSLFRDYSMLTASYLLESCHLSYLRSKNYGEGMGSIPAKLAVPLKLLADRLHYKQPLLDYAHAYAQYNWKLTNDENPGEMSFSNDQLVT